MEYSMLMEIMDMAKLLQLVTEQPWRFERSQLPCCLHAVWEAALSALEPTRRAA
jgi:hypothetical protein